MSEEAAFDGDVEDDELPSLFEPEGSGSESEADITNAEDIDFRKVVLAPSDWTVQTILSQLNSQSFELDPDFQRRNAWSDLRKSKFIESLMLGLPIPQIVLAEKGEDEDDSRYIVIDGKQRLLALESFYDEERPLRLTGLTVQKQLNTKTLQDIKDDPKISRLAKRLDNRTIRTVVIRSYPDESFLHLVFHRINHQTLPLSAQELRQALEPGPFTRFADKRAGQSEDIHRIIGASQMPDFRMRDVELLVRFISFQRRITEYKGNLKRFLDDTCKNFNKSWPDIQEEMETSADGLDLAISTTEHIFREHAFRRYSEDERWEGRFNRAVFDVMCYYFSSESISAAAVNCADDIVEAFKQLSRTDPRFSRSVTSTTKTLPATVYRLQAWGEALSNVLDLQMDVPYLNSENRKVEIRQR